MARAANLTGVHIWAQEFFDTNFRSGIFDMPVLLAAFSRNGTAAGGFGGSDQSVAAVIGGPKAISDNQLASTDGSTQRQIIFNTGEVGGGKYLATDGTTSSTGADRSDEQWASAYISWCLYEQPISVKNSVLRKARGGFKMTASVFEKVIQQAQREANKQIATDLYTGNPSSQTAEDWDAPLGLQQWIRDTGVIGGFDRTNDGLDAALYNTSATNVNLKLLDDTNLEGPAQKGGNIDLWITTTSIYQKLKTEFQASGQTIVVNSIPEEGQVGFIKEFFNYNGMMVTFDPFCPASHLFGLTTSSWLFETAPFENWRVHKFLDLREDGPPGSQDLTTSKVGIQYRLTCEEPWLNVQFTNVS